MAPPPYENLAAQLQRFREEWQRSRARRADLPAELRYGGPADFVLAHGERHDPVAAIAGAPNACFGNAIAIAELLDLRYVEGYALPFYLASQHVQFGAIHHAWVWDPVVQAAYEVTWPAIGAAYCGVTFSVGRADDATWNGDASVLDDFNRGWPVLREPWTGEDFDREWEPTEALRVIRSAGDPIGRVRALRAWLKQRRAIAAA